MNMKREGITSRSRRSSSFVHNLMCTSRLGLLTSLLLMMSSSTINRNVHGFHITKMTTSSTSRTASTLRASLRDLLNDDDHPKNKGDEKDSPGFFSKIHKDAEKHNTGFPSRSKRVVTEEEEEMGQHVDRLGTFSFSSGRSSGNRNEKRLADAQNFVKYGPSSETTDPIETKEGITSKTNTIVEELSPDNYNNRGVFKSRHRYPKEPQIRSVAGGINSNVSTKDNHDGALDTFSFASSGSTAEPSSTTASDTSMNEMVVGKQGVSSKTLFPNSKMDRLGTFSLAKTPMVDTIGPSVPTRTDREDDDRRRGTYSLANEPTAADYVGPYVPSTETDVIGSVENISADNHGDRMSTFSFASTTPKSSSGDSSTDIQQQGSSSTSFKSTMDSSPTIQQSQQPKSLSSLASSLSTTTRNDRINAIKARNDPRTLHPDGMNVPRLNKGGFVMSMSGREGKMNIFQRIDEELGSTEEERAAVAAAEEMKNEKLSGSFSDGYNDADEEVGGTTTDWGDLSEAMGRGGTKNNEGKDDDSNIDYGGYNNESPDCFIGFDLGTSGARISIVEKQLVNSDDTGIKWDYAEVFAAALSWDDILRYDDAYDWRSAVDALLMRAREDVPNVMARVKSICISGTSATCLLLKKGTLDVTRVARMYNFDILANNKDNGKNSKSDKGPAERVIKLIEQYVPEKHTARATSGSLAKLLLWNEEEPLVDDKGIVKEILCHQSDYISLSLMYGGVDEDCAVRSDWHNCLKLGYDVKSLTYPDWMLALLKDGAKLPSPSDVLPSEVVSPGEPMGTISSIVASKYGLNPRTVMVGGTTDSNAAFFAAAGAKPPFGLAVTSLGSTVALKQLSSSYVEDATKGVYSHRFPRFDSSEKETESWLIGGASNVGCAILRKEDFSNEELKILSSDIDPTTDSPLSYYPLTKKGERFPVADSTKEPILEPKPNDRREYLHGILQAIGDVERDGYRTLGDLGATPSRPVEILTCGGGSNNEVWTEMRQRRLKDICNEGQEIAVRKAINTEASYGAALLAAASFE